MFKGFKKRRLAVALGACMMVPPVAVHALGMGEIEVHSALNEPLKAQIKLLSATTAELSALQVALASSEAFSRMGIERTQALRDLRFEVVTQGTGAPYIKIASDVPMREPFLDMILMANWANGQLMREYTLLLDPPVFDEGGAVAPVKAAKTESAAIDRGDKKAVAAAPAAKSAPWVAPAGSYGPTSRTDTLWSVAQEMRPNSSVPVPQMMIALLKENPEAFVDGNVNNLKAGYILRSPSMDVINSISSSQAAAETNRHYQAWQAAAGKSSPVANGRQQLTSAETATDSAAAMPTISAVASESGVRLKLLTPEDSKQKGGAGSSVQGKATVTEQLAMALETSEATKQENAELKARLTDLERQLQAVQRLLTLKGDTLGALQAGLGEQAPGMEGHSEVAAPSVVDSVPAAEQAVAAPAVEDNSTAPMESTPEAKPAPVAKPEPIVEAGLIDQIMADPVLLAASAGGPLLLLLVVALIRRRRQQAELQEIDALAGAGLPMGGEGKSTVAMAGDGAGNTSKSRVADEENFGEMIDESVNRDFGVASGMGAIQAEENEIDPIAEADVYLAYRRYEQAEALLKEAIRHDGGRNELKLKLLEIYFTTKDKDAFEAQAEALYAALAGQEGDLWGQAVEMGREISPEHPLFAEAGSEHRVSNAGAAGAVAAASLGAAVADEEFSFEKDSSDLAGEFSFDLSDDDLVSSLNMPSPGDAELDDDGDLLDLDTIDNAESFPSLDDADLAVSEELEELSSADEFSLDDDLVAAGEEQDFEVMGKPDANEALASDDLDFDGDLIGGDALNDLGGGFDDIEGIDLDQMEDLQESEIVADAGAVKGGDESDKWTIAPAISSFNSRDVKSEMDDGYVPVTNVGKDGVGTHNLDHLSLDGGDAGPEDEPESNIFEGSDDIVGTKLDLARAYIDMGDQNGARSILDEVVKEGDDGHRQEAEQLMRQIS